MEAWEVLERAADKIERVGWKQGNGSYVFRADIGHCPHSAINDVCLFIADIRDPALYALRSALGGDPCNHHEGFDAIWQWNDAPGRTKEEICAMLRAVAVSLKAASKQQRDPFAHRVLRPSETLT